MVSQFSWTGGLSVYGRISLHMHLADSDSKLLQSIEDKSIPILCRPQSQNPCSIDPDILGNIIMRMRYGLQRNRYRLFGTIFTAIINLLILSLSCKVSLQCLVQGEFCEVYHCVLESKSFLEKMTVLEHTIPFFLPVREAENDLLSSNAMKFIDHVGELLQAYVDRREQVQNFAWVLGFWPMAADVKLTKMADMMCLAEAMSDFM
ncbi:Centromere protein O [Bienertia sinuspersici]